MELKEQVAYLRGLIEGYDFQGQREEVLWTQLLNICDLISLEIEDIQEDQFDLTEYLNAVDEDLGYLEEQFYPANEDEEVGEEVIHNFS